MHHHLFSLRRKKTATPVPRRRGRLDVTIAPRGSAKSTLMTHIFPIHAMLHRTDPYILIISATMRQASQRLANVRASLQAEAALAATFPPVRSIAGRRAGSVAALEFNGCRIEAASAFSELRGLAWNGWRPSWIILDDVERSDRVAAAHHRDRLADWFREVVENLGDRYTNIDVVGTLLHKDALPARLLARPDGAGRRFASILSEAREDQLWRAWQGWLNDHDNPDASDDARRFYDDNRPPMSAGAEVLWPQREDYYDLQLQRLARGPPRLRQGKTK